MFPSLVTQVHLDDKCLIQLHNLSPKKVERIPQLPDTQNILHKRDEVDCLKRHLVQPD